MPTASARSLTAGALKDKVWSFDGSLHLTQVVVDFRMNPWFVIAGLNVPCLSTGQDGSPLMISRFKNDLHSEIHQAQFSCSADPRPNTSLIKERRLQGLKLLLTAAHDLIIALPAKMYAFVIYSNDSVQNLISSKYP
jgi:hypothetical protein